MEIAILIFFGSILGVMLLTIAIVWFFGKRIISRAKNPRRFVSNRSSYGSTFISDDSDDRDDNDYTDYTEYSAGYVATSSLIDSANTSSHSANFETPTADANSHCTDVSDNSTSTEPCVDTSSSDAGGSWSDSSSYSESGSSCSSYSSDSSSSCSSGSSCSSCGGGGGGD